MSRIAFPLVALLWLAVPPLAFGQDIPLPEHPRPDWARPAWQNLNGDWAFRFDSDDVGRRDRWFDGTVDFPLRITVPFSWGAPLSGVEDLADIGWYARTFEAPVDWIGSRVFLVIGASDWTTTVWLDGREIGTHRGGYTPFEFELTGNLTLGREHRLTVRVDDTPHPFKLEGKQGYGPARGIWQTPYLEARGASAMGSLHITPDVPRETIGVEAVLSEPAGSDLTLTLTFPGSDPAIPEVHQRIAAGEQRVSFGVPVPGARLWTLEDPVLYDVEATLRSAEEQPDVVRTYFGMRSISVVDVPGTDHPYVALNGVPIYLQLTLDQAYHPEGYYTFPSDDFVRDEILRSRRIGINGMRVHVKVGLPRKLYWADRLGMLIMADVPNSWGEPDAEMRTEAEVALRHMISRDYNHPAIFSWVVFNETWGLYTKDPASSESHYLPETQDWVVSMVRLARSLDPTRLVEDNSPCCGRGHTDTDINSWHDYLPGYAWEDRLSEVSNQTFPGSTWNFEQGYAQARQPLLNSEFGNVWGYEGSTGDVDWSWDYHRAVNAFRRHPKISGWLYTEHHDVINEWNGYWRYDRSEKETGLGELVPGMSLRDLHAPLYLVVGDELSREVRPGERIAVPLWASFLTDALAPGEALTLTATLDVWDAIGRRTAVPAGKRTIVFRPWMSEALEPLDVEMPAYPGLALLAIELADAAGTVHQRNFTTFVVAGDTPTSMREDERTLRLLPFDPAGFTGASWSRKQWNVLEGLKVNGAGSGFFAYSVPWPGDLAIQDVASASLVFEASAKQLFGKDRDNAAEMDGDYMRGRGTHDPSRNPNAYPMTDADLTPSAVAVRVNGVRAAVVPLPDDPADHRGILSWHAQPRDRKLREAGSYGERVAVAIPREALEQAAESGRFEIRLEVEPGFPGGLALYGKEFGRYPMDPTLVLAVK